MHNSLLQAEVVIKLRTFAEAWAHPGAKRLILQGRTGPVNAVEADGTLYIEAESEAEAIRSEAMTPASEMAGALKAAATTAAASEGAASPAAAFNSEPSGAAASPTMINSYAAAVSKSPVRFKLSAAPSQLSVDLKCSTAASKPAAAIFTPLEVINVCMCSVPALVGVHYIESAHYKRT